MKIISHRGAAGLELENTIASIRAGRKSGADAIEVDVRLTKDGVFVLSHDATLRRVSAARLTVQQSTAAELRTVNLHNGEPVALLTEALQAAGDMPLFIEPKASGWAKPLAKLLQTGTYHCDITVIGIDHEELHRFHKLMPDIPTYLVQRFNPIDVMQALQDAKRHKFTGICLNFWLLNPLTYWRAKRNGLDVGVYTVDWAWMARFLWKLFPDITITTNHPRHIVALRSTLQNRVSG